MNLEMTTIVLVGLCNGDSFLQTFIGIVVFRKDSSGKLEPQLINVQVGDDGTPKNPFKPDFKWKKKAQYGFSFGREVMITLDAEKKKYDFMTGINHGDSGSSGPLSNGGPELLIALDTLFAS